MGMANLVPGISGGTMLLAAGVFPYFVHAVADLSRFRFSRRSVAVLATVVLAACAVIGPLAGLISRLVVAHTWVMYSLFIGFTLGGVPLIWKMLPTKSSSFWLGTATGLLGMIALGILQLQGAGQQGATEASWILLCFAGLLGASAMVLPGLSGGYLLLVLGVYIPILNGVEGFFLAVTSADLTTALSIGWNLVFPVGIGLLVGIAGISNLLKIVLQRYQSATLGVLLGLLLGAVVGLLPFQRGVEPAVGQILKGQTVIEVDGSFFYRETDQPIEQADYPREIYQPGMTQLAGALGLIALGFMITSAVAIYGDDRRKGARTTTSIRSSS